MKRNRSKIGELEDYIKVNRAISRREEIEKHVRPIKIFGIHKSKKVYDRKRMKKELSRESSSFFA